MTAARATGATIHIYLADGTADGIWVVEKSNWTGMALMAPRTRYKELRARDDLDGPGVYLLVGPTDSGVPPVRAYIGETDALQTRLDEHNAKKDFWNRVIVFTSKDANLNKAHVRYLEHRLLALAQQAQRVELDNGNKGSLPRLSARDEAEAEGFLAEMLLIYPVLDVDAFEAPVTQSSASDRLFVRGPDADAQGVEIAGGFVVLAGSKARLNTVNSLDPNGLQLRATLLQQGVLLQVGTVLEFQKDYTFASPSQAAMVVLGRNANGRTEWKNSAGTTLKALQSAGTSVTP